MVTDLATAVVFGTANVNENVKKMRPRKRKLKTTGSSTVAIEETIGNAAHMTSRVEESKVILNMSTTSTPCTAVCQRIILSMSKVCL